MNLTTDSFLFPAHLFTARPAGDDRHWLPPLKARCVLRVQRDLDRGARRLVDSLTAAYPRFTSPAPSDDEELRLVHYLLAFAARLHITKVHYWDNHLHLFTATLDEPLVMLELTGSWLRPTYLARFGERSRQRILRFIETWLLAAYTTNGQKRVGHFEASAGDLTNAYWTRSLAVLRNEMSYDARREHALRRHWLDAVHLTRHCARWRLINENAPNRLVFEVHPSLF